MANITKFTITLEVPDESLESVRLFILEVNEKIKNKQQLPFRDSYNRQRYDKGLLGYIIELKND